MIGIDTNILIRLHIKDEPKQFAKAKKLVNSCSVDEPLFISHIVLVEWCWVLITSYKVPKTKIIEEIEIYLNADDVVLENREACRKALKLYRESSTDFADCLIGVLNKTSNCDTTYTFDKRAAKLDTFMLLE